MATIALDHVSEVWGNDESPLHFGHQFQIEEFISNAAAQKDASKRLYSYQEDKEEETAYEERSRKTETIEGQSPKATKSHHHYISSPQFIDFLKHHFTRRKPWKVLTATVTKLIVHVMIFLVALVLYSIFLTTDLNSDMISEFELIIFVYMIGDLGEEILSMVRPNEGRWSPERIFLHITTIWNFMDFLCIGLYAIAFLMHSAGSEDLIVHIRRIYSVALFVMFLRLLNVLLLFKAFGIIIIMVKEMLIDLLQYLVILLILLFAAGVVYRANVFPNHTVTAFPRQIEYWRIWEILSIPYWQVYGELDLETLEGTNTDCNNSASAWKSDVSVERCPSKDWLPPVIAAVYMMLTNWLLLNIVIAMFSARFDAVKEKSTQKWRYHRHSVIIDYQHKIPSPINIPVRIIQFLFYAKKSPCACCPCSRRNNYDGRRNTINKVHVMLAKQKELAEEIIQEEKHK